MKTERRHELQTNELADWLGTKIEALKPYSRAVLGGLIAVAVILGVYFYLSKQRAAVAAEGWDLYFEAWQQVNTRDGNTDKLSELAQSPTYRDTPAGMWARLALADYNYFRGESQLLNDRAQAKQQLKIAVDNYSSVANQKEYPLLAQRALLGKARALESLDEQDLARKAYQTLSDEQGGLYQEEAKRRLADLSTDSTKRFYDWFAQQGPRPKSQFTPGAPGMRPDFNLDSVSPEGSLFDRPPPKGDSSGDLPLTPATGQPATGEPADKDQAVPPAPPETEKKPADGSPAAIPPKSGGQN